MPNSLPFPFNAWELLSQGADARVQHINPHLRQQGLAATLAENYRARGGPQNEMYAEQLMDDPFSTNAINMLANQDLLAAQQYQAGQTGNLRAAQAATEGARADMLTSLGGPEGSQLEQGAPGAQPMPAGPGAGSPEIGATPSTASPSGSHASLLDLDTLTRMAAAGLTEEVNTLSKIRGMAMPFNMEEAFKLRDRYDRESNDFKIVRRYYDMAVAAAAEAALDEKSPGAVDFALVQALGKILDPGSVVRGSEAGFIVSSQSSVAADAVNKFLRLFSPAGELNSQARLNLMKQIKAAYESAADSHSYFLEEMNQELDSLGLQEGSDTRNIAEPVGIGLSRKEFDLEPWEALYQQSVATGLDPRSEKQSELSDPGMSIADMAMNEPVGSIFFVHDRNGKAVRMKRTKDGFEEVD